MQYKSNSKLYRNIYSNLILITLSSLNLLKTWFFYWKFIFKNLPTLLVVRSLEQIEKNTLKLN